jgi:hypothetical protein
MKLSPPFYLSFRSVYTLPQYLLFIFPVITLRQSLVSGIYIAVVTIDTSSPRVEAGSNTSTVTLRVVGGDENGSLKSETVKYGRESQRTRTKERLRWQGPAAYIKDRPVLSSERAPHKNKTVTVTHVIKIWS